MTAAQLLTSCSDRGIRLWREGEGLGVEWPETLPTVTVQRLLDALRRVKPELLALLPATGYAAPHISAAETHDQNAQDAGDQDQGNADEQLRQLGAQIDAEMEAAADRDVGVNDAPMDANLEPIPGRRYLARDRRTGKTVFLDPQTGRQRCSAPMDDAGRVDPSLA